MPKSIIIKSNTNLLIDNLEKILKEYPNIRFFCKKINGEKTIVIKCFNYYNQFAVESSKNFYGNYIYLYTCVSLILTDLIVEHFENILVKRILRYNYFYFGAKKLSKISNIANLLLSSNAPIEYSNEFFLYRKQLVLSALLKNFRKTNFLQIDGFVNFSLPEYYDFLDEIVDTVVELYMSNLVSVDFLSSILRNMFKEWVPQSFCFMTLSIIFILCWLTPLT